MNVSADRNLLFGILALQMDFITRDQLVAAMHAWVLDKKKSLGAILAFQGALRGDVRTVLDMMVEKHLEVHDRDVQKSLSALKPSSDLRHALGPLADTDVQDSLARVSFEPKPASESDADAYATRAPSSESATATWARYRIVRPHAEGGLGKVSVALDGELNREVAFKEIKRHLADDAENRRRFLLEAEITGGLEHPGVVPVYGLGTFHDGRPFYAMRFIRGDSLKDAIRQFHRAAADSDPEAGATGLTTAVAESYSTLAFRQLLGRFVDVCNAIAYAHSRGVLHRDLKPGNIMLGRYGETLVVDWGLAKPIGKSGTSHPFRASGNDTASFHDSEPLLRPAAASHVEQTVQGTALGTPAFMSPEQAAGRMDSIGPASDVYSLGATLYVILTGRPPFTDKDVGAVLMQVQKGQYPPPRQIAPGVPVALDAICSKAMSLDPTARYPTPLALAEDVEHWLADEPVSAIREPWSARAQRWVRQHRTTVSSAAAALVVAVVSLAFATMLLNSANEDLKAANKKEQIAAGIAFQREQEANRDKKEAQRQEREANAHRQEAELQRDERDRQLARARASLLTTQLIRASLLSDRDPAESRKLLEDAEACPVDLRDFAWRHYHRLAQREWQRSYERAGEVQCVVWSPDGAEVAAALWDGDDVEGTGRVKRSNRPGKIVVSNMIQGTEYTLEGHERGVRTLAFRNNTCLVAGDDAGDVIVWDLFNKQKIATFKVPGKRITSVAYSPVENVIAVATGTGLDPDDQDMRPGEVRIWDVDTNKLLHTLQSRTRSVNAVVFTPDGRKIAWGGGDLVGVTEPGQIYGEIRLVDVATGKDAALFAGCPLPIASLAISYNGETLVTGTRNSTTRGATDIRIWNAESGLETGSLSGPMDMVASLSLSHDSQFLAVAAGDPQNPRSPREVRLWNFRKRQLASVLKGHAGAVHTVAFSPDGKKLASGGWDRFSVIWSIEVDTELRSIQTPTAAVALTVDPDGSVIACEGGKELKIWNATTGNEIATLKESFGAVAFSPRDCLVAACAEPRFENGGQQPVRIRLFDRHTGNLKGTVDGHRHRISALTFSPDGTLLASASVAPQAMDGPDGKIKSEVKIWDVLGERPVRTLFSAGDCSAIAFSPDGTTLATADGSRIRLWNVSDGKQAGTLDGHRGTVHALAFSPDGKTMASGASAFQLVGSDAGEVKLWDLETRKERASPKGHREGVKSLAFSPDGKSLASGSGNHFLLRAIPADVKVWDVLTGQERISYDGFSAAVFALAFSPDGKFLVAASEAADRTTNTYWGEIKFFGGSIGDERETIASHLDSVLGIAISRDGKRLASCGRDGAARLWDFASGRLLRLLLSVNAWVTCVDFEPHDKLVAVGAGDRIVRLFDPDTGELKQSLVGHLGEISSVRFSPDGASLATSSRDQTIMIWETATGKLRRTSKGHVENVTSISWNPDGKSLASGSGDKSIRFWDLENGEEKDPILLEDFVSSIAFSPDGTRLASASNDGGLRIWNVSTRQLAVEIMEPNNTYALAWSPDGKRIATGSWVAAAAPDSDEVRLWDVVTGKLLHTLRGHTQLISTIAFAPDGTTVVSGSFDRTIKSWSIAAPPASIGRAMVREEKIAKAHLKEGNARLDLGDVEGALDEYRAALRHKQDFASAHFRMGRAYEMDGKDELAIAAYRDGLKFEQTSAMHFHLGNCLYRKGRYDEAIDAYRNAVFADGRNDQARLNLAFTLMDNEQIEDADFEFQDAIAARKDFAFAINGHGLALAGMGKFEEAAKAYRDAMKIDPNRAVVHENLGQALSSLRKYEEAVECFEKAIDLDPEDPHPHCSLGFGLQRLEKYQEALAALERGHELGRKQNWKSPSEEWVRRAKRYVELRKTLPEVLKGDSNPKSQDDLVVYAEMCLYFRNMPETAVGLYEKAFAGQPKLESDAARDVHNAACAAALAGTGQGKDSQGLDEELRGKRRSQALRWLRGEFSSLEKDWAIDKERIRARRNLRHLLTDTDLAAVRDAEALAKRPNEERIEWQQFWTDVRELLDRPTPAEAKKN